VEYAIEAIGHAGICIGILATDGVLLGVEKKIASKLLEVTTSEKMYKVSAVSPARSSCATLFNRPIISSNPSLLSPPPRSATTLAAPWPALQPTPTSSST
jgi:hypothetical protein